jgi:hypothetical protein
MVVSCTLHILDMLPLPCSSACRLGVRSRPLHELYSPAITAALRKALRRFDRSLPGFISEAGLLHGVETRTSAPVGGAGLLLVVLLVVWADAPLSDHRGRCCSTACCQAAAA